MKNTHVLLLSTLLLAGCTKWWNRAPASGKVLPPVQISGVPHAPNDEAPILATKDGFVRGTLPGQVEKKPDPKNVKVFRGRSD